jgi:aerobic carbon-monoxide dehydrogenase medium subunit
MKPAPFAYVRPRNLPELLDMFGEGDALLAGGQSLLPDLNERRRSVRRLLDVNTTEGLRHLDAGPGALVLGAITRHADLAASWHVRAAVPVLSAAAARVGHAAVRTRGTLGGSIVNADPAAELPGVAVLLDARAELRTARGTRDAPVAGLLRPGGIEPDEVLVGVTFPRMSARDGWGFRELSRPGAYAFPLVTVAAVVALADDGTVASLRAAVTGAGAAPYALEGARSLIGRAPDPEWAAEVADRLCGSADPVSDGCASAAYRRRMVRHLALRALADAVGRAREATP